MPGEPAKASRVLRSIREELARRLREQPYPVLALAALAGYSAGGGLFTPLTRPLARVTMGILLVPGLRERLRGALARTEQAEFTGAA